VVDPECRALLGRFDDAEVDVAAWNTTTDVGVPSMLCVAVDRHPEVDRPMPAVRGSGSHPCKRLALSRALTEAAQGRLTRISGSRDDLSDRSFDDASARKMAASARERMQQEPPALSFSEIPNAQHETVEEDVNWICEALHSAGFSQILAIDLTRPDFQIPVVRVVVPFLEAMSELPGYVPGERARRAMASAS
jgi:ribosomal protein S12 methylthiotransferase accessory factor